FEDSFGRIEAFGAEQDIVAVVEPSEAANHSLRPRIFQNRDHGIGIDADRLNDQFCFAPRGARDFQSVAKVRQILPGVKAYDVRTQNPVEEKAPLLLIDHLKFRNRRKGNVKEKADADAVPQITLQHAPEHGRSQQELVIVNPNKNALIRLGSRLTN